MSTGATQSHRRTAETQFPALAEFLGPHPPSSSARIQARSKLQKLTPPQFSELSMDVYDEVLRRKARTVVPYLPENKDFHPKRNQARQKLATLQLERFTDLASDVLAEIQRRFPEVAEEAMAMAEGTPKLRAEELPSQIPGIPDDETQESPQSDSKFTGTNPFMSSRSATAQSTNPAKKNILGGHPSMDNMMEDLGTMLNSNTAARTNLELRTQVETLTKDRNALQSKVQELEKDVQGKTGLIQNLNSTQKTLLDETQKEFQEREMELNKRVEVLEKEAKNQSRLVTQIQELEISLSQKQKDEEKWKTSYQKLDSKHQKLQEAYDSLNEDYKTQQSMSNDIRAEAANLLEEIKVLTSRSEKLTKENQELLKKKDADHRRIVDLEQEVKQVKFMKGDSNMSRNLNNNSPGSERPDSPRFDDNTVVSEDKLFAYRGAVKDLNDATRLAESTGVLLAMKKIVMACKNITEDVESHETDRTPDISRIKTDLSISLTQLMTSAKAHATSSTSATVNDIERTSERVTEIIVQLVNSITTSDDSVAEGANRTDQVMANYMPRDVYSPMTTKDPAKSTLELKSFLEMQTDTIVQSIQSLLNAMRQPGPYGRDFLAIVGDISDVVNAVITESKGTLANTEFGDKAGVILVDLVKVLKQLEGLGQEMVNVSPSKSLKQKMASSSYEIAKYVKELLNVLD